jgi:ABC-2 type transport system ATP-binding protein
MAEMAQVADELIVISRGRLLAETSVREFIGRHGRTFVRVRTPEPLRAAQEFQAKGATAVRRAADGGLEVDGLPAGEVNRIAAAAGVPVEELSTHTGSLEETFLKLVDDGGDPTHV